MLLYICPKRLYLQVQCSIDGCIPSKGILSFPECICLSRASFHEYVNIIHLFCQFRFLKELKKTIGNKARVEGSICEAYIAHEITLLVRNYAQNSLHCRMRKPGRHDEGNNTESQPQFSVFNYPARFQGKQQSKWLEREERNAAHLCVLRNCPEVQPILE